MKPMMNDDGLLECPFCNSNDVYPDSDLEGKKHFIWCGNCGCGTGVRPNKSSAVRKWNTRNGHLYTADDYKQDALERANGL
nr:MAG TPA: restriction alleviation protein [Caudoviricetes sp.]